MQLNDTVKYLPTSTVGKIVGFRDQDGRSWAKLDYTSLWYDVTQLTPCDPSEYKAVSVKYREVKEKTPEELLRQLGNKEDVDISGFSPTA
ncbi:MAG: DUF2098 family protein [Candidatus Methanomethylophilaceae archaeon]|nr:DUF2098 family protein [Candidatus Methanomethylophilaceae archaeon]